MRGVPADCNRVSATLETTVGDGRGIADEFELVLESSSEGGTARAVINIRDVGGIQPRLQRGGLGFGKWKRVIRDGSQGWGEGEMGLGRSS